MELRQQPPCAAQLVSCAARINPGVAILSRKVVEDGVERTLAGRGADPEIAGTASCPVHACHRAGAARRQVIDECVLEDDLLRPNAGFIAPKEEPLRSPTLLQVDDERGVDRAALVPLALEQGPEVIVAQDFSKFVG